MNEKVISNTFTVNTVVDGISQQQIFYRSSSSNPASIQIPPQTQIDKPTLPTGWSYGPQGVTTTYRYEYVSQRTKENGVWSVYSPPVHYAYRAQDGTSISIQGVAIAIDPATMPSNPRVGDAVLYTDPTSSDDAEVWDGSDWSGENYNQGTGFILESNGHLYQRTRSGAATKWQDVGQIKGDDGDPAVSYQIIIDSASAIVKADGKLYAYFLCHALKNVGGTPTIATDGYMDVDGANCSEEGNNKFGDDGMFNGVTIPATKTELLLEYKVSNVTVATANIPIAINGRASRNLWFAGDYNTVKGQSFTVTDASAPYVQTGWSGNLPVCYAFVGENGRYVFPSTDTAYQNADDWKSMESSFQYLITKAVFAALAKLGLWTFNGNMMYSDLGLNLNNNQETQQGSLVYTGIGAQGNTFTPNAAIDASNGVASFGRDKVRFEKDGSGYLANNNIKWDANGNTDIEAIVRAKLSYSPTLVLQGSTTINPATHQAGCFVLAPQQAGMTLTLPLAASYDGLELNFYSVYGSRQTGLAFITVQQGEYPIAYQSFHVYKTLSPAFVASEANSSLPIASTLYLFPNNYITLKSMPVIGGLTGEYRWYVIRGMVSEQTPTY